MITKKRVILIDDDYTTNTLNKLIIEKSELVDTVLVFDQAETALDFLKTEKRTIESGEAKESFKSAIEDPTYLEIIKKLKVLKVLICTLF